MAHSSTPSSRAIKCVADLKNKRVAVGRHYDWSEVTFLFEREADEDDYPTLEVDGAVVRRFDFKQLSYELSLMGQQVGE